MKVAIYGDDEIGFWVVLDGISYPVRLDEYQIGRDVRPGSLHPVLFFGFKFWKDDEMPVSPNATKEGVWID